MGEKKTQSVDLETVENSCYWGIQEDLSKLFTAFFADKTVNHAEGTGGDVGCVKADGFPVGAKERNLAEELQVAENPGSVGDSTGDEGREVLGGSGRSAGFFTIGNKEEGYY